MAAGVDAVSAPGSCFLTVQPATAVECALGPVAVTQAEAEAISEAAGG